MIKLLVINCRRTKFRQMWSERLFFFFSLQREEALKQKRELSLDLCKLRDELGKSLMHIPNIYLHATHTQMKLMGDNGHSNKVVFELCCWCSCCSGGASANTSAV